jgi:hypothetical protein
MATLTAPKVKEKVNGQITAWSFSRWQDHEQCPYKAGLKHVNRKKEPGNQAMDRGSEIHTLAEQYTSKTLRLLPPALSKFKEKFAKMRKLQPAVEQQWAFTHQWARTGWFDRDTWLRIVVDAHYLQDAKPIKGNTLVIIDHKTGKKDPIKHDMQLSLYNLGGMLMYPDVAKIRSELWYLDIGDVAQSEVVVNSKVLTDLQKLWVKRTQHMLTDKTFAPRPGPYCNWCHFAAKKGGPCPY